MKNMKKIFALGLAAVMALAMAGCGESAGNGNTGSSTAGNGNTAGGNTTTQNGTRKILIGTWWVQHYDSADSELADSPDWLVNQDKEGDDEATLEQNAINRASMEKRFADVAAIEARYNVEYYWTNLTYTGVQESINNSILAGSPDCDIYLVDASMAIPAQMNGLALDLKTVLPADHDLFTTQTVMKYLDLGDGRACIIQRQGGMTNTYPLGINLQLLDDYGLEDPRDLYARGEWTWDKFIEYCQKVTEDTDGDGQIDQYGYDGFKVDTFENLMMSNGANIAAGTTENLTSPAMGEVLQMIADMYTKYKVCAPYDDTADANAIREGYRKGNLLFFPIAVWIQQQDGSDYDWDGALGYTLPFDIAYCPWPVGPSGNQETNPQLNNTGAEIYIIPAGVQDPETVVNVLYDMWNWYEGDITKRDNPALNNWWVEATARTDELRQANYQVQVNAISHQTVDLFNVIGVGWDMAALMNGDVTPSQFQETYKQEVQNGLDAYFGK